VQTGPLQRDLRTILLEGMAVGVMVGAGENYLAAFALSLGYGDVVTGLITSLPLLGGALLQLGSPRMVERLGSNRRWVVLCAALQAGSLLPLLAGALLGKLPLAAFAVAVAFYWGVGLATGPPWTVWVEPLVPAAVRTRFFARRTMASQAMVLCALLSAGTLLQLGQRVSTFAGVFAIAAVARLLSATLLFRTPEPRFTVEQLRARSLAELLSHPSARAGRAVLLYMLVVQLVVNISGPYFNPYMLRLLKLPYWQYTLVGAAIFVARIATLHLVGRYGGRLQARTMLWIGGIAIIPMSGVWVLSGAFSHIICMQVAAGIAWAVYELSALLLFFEAIPTSHRTGLLTLFNAANSGALVAGSALGGALLRLLGTGRRSYHLLFLISSAGRAVALLALGRVPATLSARVRPVTTRTLSVRTVAGGVHRPVLPGIDTDTASEPGD